MTLGLVEEAHASTSIVVGSERESFVGRREECLLAPFMGFGFRVSRFGRGGFQDGFRVSGFGKCGLQVGFRVS